jgi:hypothetical protein
MAVVGARADMTFITVQVLNRVPKRSHPILLYFTVLYMGFITPFPKRPARKDLSPVSTVNYRGLTAATMDAWWWTEPPFRRES